MDFVGYRPRENGIRNRTTLRIATLNVGTLRGKEEEMVMVMRERRIDILEVCETRLSGGGVKVLHDDFQLIYSGGQDNIHGVGVILSPELAQRVNNFEQVNERMLTFSLKMNEGNLSFIQVYVPQQGRPTEEREVFYQELQIVKDRVPHHENVILMGDLNGHVGQDRRGIENVIGAHSIGDRNAAGDSVVDFCVQNNMSIMNTFYKHRESHKWTWYRWSNDRWRYEDRSMIDLMITNNKRLFRDVKSIPSVSCDSDHRLVIRRLRIDKQKRISRGGRKRFMVENLQDQACRDQLQREMSEARRGA